MPNTREQTRKEKTHDLSSSFPSRKLLAFLSLLLILLALPVTIFLVNHQQIFTRHASSTDSARVEAESGTLSATGAQRIADTSATGGQAIEFTGSIPGNPEDTSANVHPAQGSISSVSNCCTALFTANPPVRFVWNWNNGDATQYPTTYKGFYFPADRQPDITNTTNAKPLSWFKTNHNNWIEYTCAAASVPQSQADAYVAYEFGDTSYLPLDTANPAVLAWEEQQFWGPTAASGKFQELSFDNFQLSNGGSWSGQRCGHYDTSGKWVGQYSGTENDPAYRQAEIQLATNLRTWLHSNYPKVAFSPNASYDNRWPSDSDSLISQADILWDEWGFTNDGISPYQIFNSSWVAKAQHMSTFLAKPGKGWVDQNVEPVNASNLTTAQKQWALGNYLLLKNRASWIIVGGPSEVGFSNVLSEYAAQIGTPTDTYYANQGVYRRDFTNGLVFVNPSSTTSYMVTIPANTYKDLYGNRQGSSMTLGPGTAIILLGSSSTNPTTTGSCAFLPLPTGTGRDTATIRIPTTGSYTLWSRMMVPSTSANSYYLQVDSNCPVLVADMTRTNSWDWVLGQGSPTLSLSTGSHTLTLIGNQAGVKVDELVFSQSCSPTGTGANCFTTVTPASQSQAG